MQTIETYVLPAANHKRRRIKGIQVDSSWTDTRDVCTVTVSDHDESVFQDDDGNPLREDQKHARVALMVMEKLNWCGELSGGHSRRGMVWVFTNTGNEIKRDEHGKMELDIGSKWERTIKDADYRLIK